MLLGVVSDTHGHVEETRDAVRMLSAMEVDEVIHCGDIGSVPIIEMFSDWPTHFVLGNVDSNGDELREAIEAAGQTFHNRYGSIEREGRKIAFLHGDDDFRLSTALASGDWDLVCSGHTHQRSEQQHGKTIALNPGAIHRANPRSIAMVDLPSLEINSITL